MQPARRVLASAHVAAGPGAFTCRSCVQRRAFSRSAPRSAAVPNASPDTPTAPAAPVPAGIAQLASRRLISVSGPDAARYLQGVITANLFPGSPATAPSPSPEHLRPDAGFYAAFLTAPGRVLHDVFIYRDVRDADHPPGHSWLIEVDAAEADRLQKHIRRYKLRAKFDVRLLDPAEARVWHAWDDAAQPPPTSPPPPSTPHLLTTRDPRAPNLGHRILAVGGSAPDPQAVLPAAAAGGAGVVPEAAYTLRRYLHGVAEGQSEILPGQALPHESNLDLMRAVDFRKGCYVGQELTIRTEHRGVVRKRIVPCLLYPDGPAGGPEAGVGSLAEGYRPFIGGGDGGGAEALRAEMVPAEASIGRAAKKGRSAGKWLRGIGNVGLALCRLEIMTDVVLPGESGGTGYAPGDEFVIGLGGEGGEGGKVKIKAFVPEWLRSGLAAKETH